MSEAASTTCGSNAKPDSGEPDAEELERRKARAEKRKAKRERGNAKKNETKEKKAAKKARKREKNTNDFASVEDGLQSSLTGTGKSKSQNNEKKPGEPTTKSQSNGLLPQLPNKLVQTGSDLDSVGSASDDAKVSEESSHPVVSKHLEAETTDVNLEAESPTPATSAHDSPLFDNLESSSSISSTSNQDPIKPTIDTDVPPTAEAPTTSSTPTKALKHPPLPEIDPGVLRARLHARITAMRAARHADGPDGKPARSRSELMEARRQKWDKRTMHKKDQRALEKRNDSVEAEVARLRGPNPSILFPSGPNAYSYSRVAFDDGAEMDPELKQFLKERRELMKGKSDPKTALLAAQNKAKRVAGFDEEKRADIEDKDAWLNAKRRVHGEKVRDDVSLLKKTVKRKEQTKAKSEKEWKERAEGVQKGQDARQAKREQNLQKRKDEKGNKGKKSTGRYGISMNSGVKKPPVKRRPGFEGTFKMGIHKRT